jgi:hypothetical protein
MNNQPARISSRKLTPFARVFISVIIIGVLVFTLHHYGALGLLSRAKKGGVVAMPGKIDVPVTPVSVDVPAAPLAVSTIPMPTHQVAATGRNPFRLLVWAWNAQMGMLYANGGRDTTSGSLMEQQNVSLHLERQDDGSVMQAELAKCAKQLAGGATDCTEGASGVLIMGGQARKRSLHMPANGFKRAIQ